MKRASLILALLGSVGSVVVACGGATSTDVFGTPTDSSGTSGGTSGTATSGGTSGTATSGGTSGAIDAGPSKTCVSNDGCAATEYCKRTTCTAGSGVCTTRPAETATEAPVCGCDNVTYWNESVAAHDGVNLQAGLAECPKTSAVKCDGNSIPCANNRSCSFPLNGSAQCNVGVGIGTCWALPTSCAGVAAKDSVCGSGKCVSRCEAIRNEDRYFTNSNCP